MSRAPIWLHWLLAGGLVLGTAVVYASAAAMVTARIAADHAIESSR